MSVFSPVRRLVSLPVKSAETVLGAPGVVLSAVRQTVNDVTDLVAQGGMLIERVVVLVNTVEVLVRDIAVIAGRAAAVVDLSDAVAVDAASAVLTVDTQLLRTQQLLDAYAPLLVELQPLVQQAAGVLEPRHVDAVRQLLDLTPDVIDLITPALRNLGDLTPELHQLSERFEAVGQIVEGIPGAALFKRRAADDHDESE